VRRSLGKGEDSTEESNNYSKVRDILAGDGPDFRTSLLCPWVLCCWLLFQDRMVQTNLNQGYRNGRVLRPCHFCIR